jgi:hypothetical protein
LEVGGWKLGVDALSKFTVRLNLAKRGLRIVVGLSQLAPFNATS